MHTGLHNHGRIGAGRFPRQGQAVACEIADAMENLGRHVIVAQDHGVFLPLQAVDGRNQGGMYRPFHFRNDLGNLGVKAVGGPRHRIGISQFDTHLASPHPPINTHFEYKYGAKKPAFKSRFMGLCYT
jgi:hypothetical protein